MADLLYLVEELQFSWTDVKQVLLNGVKMSFTELDSPWEDAFEKQIDDILAEYVL